MIALSLAVALTQLPHPPAAPLVTKVYAVAELVVPVPTFALPAAGEPAPRAERWRQPTAAEGADELVRQLTAVVRPASWEHRGGRGRVEYFDIGHALVVTQSADVLAEVDRLIAGLRRLQNVAFATETVVLTGPAGFGQRAGLRPDGVLSAAVAARAIVTAEADRRVTSTQLPKITTFNGQYATFLTGEQRALVTGVDLAVAGGKVEYRPRRTAVDVGDRLTLCGRLSADESAVTLRAAFTRTRLSARPVFATIPGDTPQTVEVADPRATSAEREVRVRDGETLVVGRWAEADGTEVWVLATVRVIRDAE